mgnify:FL=1
MTCSFDTMLTTVLTSFILYLIVSFLFINSKRILIVGYRTVVYICLLSILRLVLSIEFSFSVHINLNTFFLALSFFFVNIILFFIFLRFRYGILLSSFGELVLSFIFTNIGINIKKINGLFII